MSSNGEAKEADFVGEGWHEIDEHLVSARPPKIRWGERYLSWSPQKKIEYLEKFAASRNHAAYLIQGERDQLNELCEKKEAQIHGLGKAMAQNSAMLQTEVTKMNAQRQDYHRNISRLNAEIKVLKANGPLH